MPRVRRSLIIFRRFFARRSSRFTARECAKNAVYERNVRLSRVLFRKTNRLAYRYVYRHFFRVDSFVKTKTKYRKIDLSDSLNASFL